MYPVPQPAAVPVLAPVPVTLAELEALDVLACVVDALLDEVLAACDEVVPPVPEPVAVAVAVDEPVDTPPPAPPEFTPLLFAHPDAVRTIARVAMP